MNLELGTVETRTRRALVVDGARTVPTEDALAGDLKLSLGMLRDTLAAPVPRWPRAWLSPVGDPTVRKYLNRLTDGFGELLRLRELGLLVQPDHERRAADLSSGLRSLLHRPEYDIARALYHDAQLLLADAGDADVICGFIESERRWEKSTTSWLTWDTLYGTKVPAVLELHHAGKPIPADTLTATRNKLVDLYRARREDELVQRCRAAQRGRILGLLTVALALLLVAFLPAVWAAREPRLSAWLGLAVVLAGALGAAVAGTIKARDRLRFESEITRFWQELVAQLLIGAVAAVIVYAVLRTVPITISDLTLDLDTLGEKVALAFAAGFSEPFFLKTIERITKPADDDSPT